MIFLFLAIILFAAIIINNYVYRLKLSTAAGASVMAIGIMMKGIFTENGAFPIVSDILFYCMILLTYWIIIHYTLDLIQGSFFSSHLEHPILSFSTGTWLAALSIMTVVLFDKDYHILARTIFTINFFIWLLYFGWMIRNYFMIFRDLKNYIHHIQGGLLLTCVSTQSIVIAGSITFSHDLSINFLMILFFIGFFFYLFNLGLIVFRYILIKNRDLTESWTNTNCIIHGALSITGVSLTFAFPDLHNVVGVIWVGSLLLFIIVESIEILRCVQRIRKLGWKKAIFIYFPTQWARVFTFGMFLFFTERIHIGGVSIIDSVQSYIILLLPKVILALILVEVVLLMTHLYKNIMNIRRQNLHLSNQQNSRNV